MGEVDTGMEDSPDTEKGTAKLSAGSEQIPAGQVLTLAAGSPWKSDLLTPLQQTKGPDRNSPFLLGPSMAWGGPRRGCGGSILSFLGRRPWPTACP